jgi:hypothetical protein
MLRGLKTKLPFFRDSVSNLCFDLLYLSETWLNDSISNMELGLCDYNVFRDDRDNMLNSRGGGVLLAVKNKYDCSLINVDYVPGIQHIFVLLKYNKINILLGCVYISPSSHRDLYMKHCEIVENSIHNYSILNVLIIGDFNLSGFPWSDYALYSDPIANVFIQSYLCYLGLKQVNNVCNFRNDILDLVVSIN